VAQDWADWQSLLAWLQQPSTIGAKNLSAAASMQQAR
jgi:hypothetical protein